jgi:hypothetical protein
MVVDRAGTVTLPSFWRAVFGSTNAETVLLTDNETAVHLTFALLGGKNKVDYSALTATITANIGSTNVALASLEQLSTANGDVIAQTHSAESGGNSLTLVGSATAGDQLVVNALITGGNHVVTVANPGADDSQLDPRFRGGSRW